MEYVHAPEHDHNRRLGVRHDPKTLPDHQTRRNDRREVQNLKENLFQTLRVQQSSSQSRTGRTYMAKAKPSKGLELFCEHRRDTLV